METPQHMGYRLNDTTTYGVHSIWYDIIYILKTPQPVVYEYLYRCFQKLTVLIISTKSIEVLNITLGTAPHLADAGAQHRVSKSIRI